METFKVKSYTKKELAQLYFPEAHSPHAAVNRLMAWIRRCRPLQEALANGGYAKHEKLLSQAQVQLIVNHLGEP